MAVTATFSTYGRSAGFADLYRRLGQDALRYAAGFVGAGDADDVCQEAWLRIWQCWDQGTAERREAWAWRVVRNCALQRRRWRRRHPTEPLDDLDVAHAQMVEDVVLIRVGAQEALQRVSRLPWRQRDTLLLREVADLTYGEIAAIQGIPIGTVMSRLHTARRNMERRR